MERRVILDFQEIQALIEHVLHGHIGVIAATIDLPKITLQLLDDYFYGTISISHELIDPVLFPRSDPRLEVIEEMRAAVFKHIQSGLGQVVPSRTYTYDQFGRSIAITETSETPRYVKPIEIDVDDTDGWVPERQRHRR